MTRFPFAAMGNGLALILVLLSLGTMMYFGYQFYVEPRPDIANVFTGAGAVLAASVSALVAFRSVAIVEESQRPYPYPYIDVKSRQGLSLIKIKNAGGSAAHRVYLDWDGGVPSIRQGSQSEAQPIHFAGDAGHAIAVLMPGDEQATMLGAHHWVAQQIKANKNELKGKVVFQDAKGKVHRLPFFVDTSFYEWALADETELLKSQHALTKVPDMLEKMSKSLAQISKVLTK
jgi:hypothetical protein